MCDEFVMNNEFESGHSYIVQITATLFKTTSVSLTTNKLNIKIRLRFHQDNSNMKHDDPL